MDDDLDLFMRGRFSASTVRLEESQVDAVQKAIETDPEAALALVAGASLGDIESLSTIIQLAEQKGVTAIFADGKTTDIQHS